MAKRKTKKVEKATKITNEELNKVQSIINDKVTVNFENAGKKVINIELKYSDEGASVISGMNRLSKPGNRVYSSFDNLPRNNGGLGTVIVSTSRGLLSDSEARKRKLGGELICEVWSWVELEISQSWFQKGLK